ncbi:hypothetical protein CkaCkLH20_11383 [Colletotrichum karsti]|uniref:Uncharacterized protein n=1 Tax=Colletotrichum karsti TaxID=1095194 RepID=A0A9P6LDA0_9PEZI|nr:uncharacterized protein CkaCkLH20_11383 [Colletotrichum karsti]KAF9871214.1 hypothetical protein CkaCkLH20_11383 [Colletotrichum karsti]
MDEPLIAKSPLAIQVDGNASSQEHVNSRPNTIAHEDGPLRSSTQKLEPPKWTMQSNDAGKHENDTQNVFGSASKNPSIMRLWSAEVITLAVAAILMGIILAILLDADDKPQDDWFFPLNINSVLATLSVMYRSLLVTVSAEALSQFKWIWFFSKRSPPRSLHHINVFDNASRGIWGALQLFPLVVFRDLACIPPLLVVLFSFAIGPFIQQAITIYDKTLVLPSGSLASIPITQTVGKPAASPAGINSSDNNYFGPGIRGFVYSALGYPQNNRGSIEVECDTGYCIFSPNITPQPLEVTHASIGICSQCEDRTYLAREVDESYVELPNGMQFNVKDDQNVFIVQNDDDLSWAFNDTEMVSKAYLGAAFANVTFLSRTREITTVYDEDREPIRLSDPSLPYFAAGVCSLWPCLQYYQGKVNNGTLVEKKLLNEPMYPDAIDFAENDQEVLSKVPVGKLPVSWNITAIQSPCRMDDSAYDYGDLQARDVGQLNHLAKDSKVRIVSPANAPDYPVESVPESCVFRMSGAFRATMASLLSKDIFNGKCSRKKSTNDTLNS